MMLLLHVLMLSLLSGGSARVLINTNFEQECGEFFAGGKPPTRFSGEQYKQICQTLNGVVHYATYYDTDNKIPVYSAYKYEGTKRCTRKSRWFIEPQLVDSNNNKESSINMAYEDVKVNEDQRGKYQALNGDYEKSTVKFDKGHLAPVSQARSRSCSHATFTLTNAAPQNPSFNRGQWRVIEGKIAALSQKCLSQKDSVYIVTGVVPGNNYITYNEVNRVNVPSNFWTAYCCLNQNLDQNKKCSDSGGFIGENKKKDSDPENKNILLQSIAVNELETQLAKLYGKSFKVFTEHTAKK